MVSENISLEDDERDALARLVAEALLDGDSRKSVLADLSNNGIADEEAEELVSLVELQLNYVDVASNSHSANDGEGGMGWAVWIVVIVVIKILSAFF